MSSYLSSLVDYFSRSFYGKRSPETVVTSSAVVVHSSKHRLKVSRYLHNETNVMSNTFRVGNCNWAIRYYPNGDATIADGQFSSVFLQLMSACKSEVTASCTFSLHAQDPAAPEMREKNKFGFTHKFLFKGEVHGMSKFVSKADLAASVCLKDDCLVIKCIVEVIDDHKDDEDTNIAVPPSDLSKNLSYLLENGFKADLTIRVGSSKSFKVHGCMLAARSPVFRALLCGSMTESKERSISVEDMDANVFEVLMYYIYNDCLPKFMDDATEGATNIARHLLVAADRYAVERLKLICEKKLSKALDANTVGFILDLAEQYHCHQLKAHGLEYIEKNSERLLGIENTEDFAQLKLNHPLLARDILGRLQHRIKRNRKKTSH